jgi:DNA polymerase
VLTLFIDFETAYSTKDKYGLRDMSMVEYIRDPRFKAFGLAYASETGSSIWIPAGQVHEFLQKFATSVGWPNIAVVGHNVKFDAFILREQFEVVPGQYIDTKGMSRTVLGKTIKGHSLADLAEHFDLPSKGVMKTDGKWELSAAEESELADYCIHDVELCRAIYQKLAPEFPESQWEPMHQTIDMFVNPGLILNVPLLQETARKEAKRRTDIFKEIGIEKATFASNVKFPDLLASKGYETPLKSSPKRRDEAGNPLRIPALALQDTAFLDMLQNSNDELRLLCEARVAAKSTLLETRSIKLAKIGESGPWPFDVEQAGADQTHRLSGGSGAGGNPQNFTKCQNPKEHNTTSHYCRGMLRYSVGAPEGWELVVGDFAGIDFRFVAYLSKCQAFIDAIEKGTDVYCEFSTDLYGRPITKAENPKERELGKTIVLARPYGMGSGKLVSEVRKKTGQTITKEEAKEWGRLYNTKYPEIPALWKTLESFLPAMTHKGTSIKHPDLPITFAYERLILPDGVSIRYKNLRSVDGQYKKDWLYDIWEDRRLVQERIYGGKMLGHIGQGLTGVLCREAMTRFHRQVKGQLHDEIILLVRKQVSQGIAQKLKRVMSTSPDWLPQMKVDCEIGVGKNWGEAKG